MEATPEIEAENILTHYSSLSEDDLADIIQKKTRTPYYWSAQIGETKRYPEAHIKTAAILKSGAGITTYDLSLLDHNNKMATITHISCWPDGSIPHESYTADIARNILSLAHTAKRENSLIYIHCRAGLGRTGVFRLALEYALRELNKEPLLSAAILLKEYRKTHRYGVQTELVP